MGDVRWATYTLPDNDSIPQFDVEKQGLLSQKEVESKGPRPPNIQDLIRYVALITMITDHYGLLVSGDLWQRAVGRTAMPLYLFLVGYNMKQNTPRFICLIDGFFVTLSQYIAYGYFYGHALNIMWTIFFGMIYCYFFQNHFSHPYKRFLHILLVVFFGLYTRPMFDYGSGAWGIMISGIICRRDPKLKVLTGLISAAIGSNLVYTGFWSSFKHDLFCKYAGISSMVVVFILLGLCDFTRQIPFTFMKKLAGKGGLYWGAHLFLFNSIMCSHQMSAYYGFYRSRGYY